MTHEAVHEAVGEIGVGPRDLDDPGQAAVIPAWRNDALLAVVVVGDDVPREAEHLGHVVDPVAVDRVAEDKDGAVGEERELVEVAVADVRDPVGRGLAGRTVRDPPRL